MILANKIKLEVSEEDAQTLEFMQAKCRGLYNWWISRLRDGEKWPGWKVAKKTLQESRKYDPELGQVYSKLLQEVYFRILEPTTRVVSIAPEILERGSDQSGSALTLLSEKSGRTMALDGCQRPHA